MCSFWTTLWMYNKIVFTSVGSSGAGSTGCEALYCFVLLSAANAFETLKRNHIVNCRTTTVDDSTANSITFECLLAKTGRKRCIITRIETSLVPVFQSSFRLHILPACWLHALVTPVFKKGLTSSPSNYRPIYPSHVSVVV